MRHFVIITSLIVLFLSYYPSFYHWRNTPPDRVWAGTTLYSDDYAVYLHTINQGTRGRWTVVDKFTAEPHTGSLLHIYYLLAGKLLGFFSISPILTYQIIRVFGSLVFLVTAWAFTKTVLTQTVTRILAWTFISFAGSLPAKYFRPDVSNWLPWLADPEVSLRFAIQPHHTLGAGLLLLSLTLFLKYLRHPSRSGLILACSITFLNSWIEPNTSFVALIVIAILSLYRLLTNKPEIPIFLMTVATTAAPGLVYFRLLKYQEPWTTLFLFDSSQHFLLPPTQFISALGFPLIVGSLLLVPLLIRWKKLPQLFSKNSLGVVIAWIFTFFLLLELADWLNINRLRFYRQPIFVALSITASVAIYFVGSLISPRFPKSVSALLVAVFILVSTPSTIASFKSRIHEYDDRSTLIYPTKDEKSAFDWLSLYTSANSPVLALYEASNLIPVFSNNTVYAGNLSETINYQTKSVLATSFFQSQMTPTQAREFLATGNIKYVFFGFQENQGLDPGSLPFLKLVYQNPTTRIFQVN